ncbi:MAG: signal peptidase II [Lachnospiraceae bacterium]|nr:signal peptidase II [Lachnospiraceae bacterium]MBR3036035.1 signal peptidase II [Lachnospiraceae bacterium]
MKKNVGIVILSLVLSALLVLLDQWTKGLAVSALKGQPDVILIRGALQLTYVENTGIAFGLFQGKQYIFAVFTALILAFLLYLLYRIPKKKRCLPAILVMILLIAGSVGNMIDRISLQYVVDFIYFSLIHFPVFNVADIYVTVSCILLIILVLFVYRDDEISEWFLLKKKTEPQVTAKEDLS